MQIAASSKPFSDHECQNKYICVAVGMTISGEHGSNLHQGIVKVGETAFAVLQA